MSGQLNRRKFLGATIGGTLTAAVVRHAPALGAAGADGPPKDVEPRAAAAGRVARLLARVSGMPPAQICFERTRLMTQSYRQTEGQPAILRRAKAFYAVAEGMPIHLDDDELIVGNIASRPRYAYFAPESYNWTKYRPGQEQVLSDNRFSHELDIRFHIPEEIAEYWRKQPQCGTAGHFIADYEKVLRKGFTGIRAEAAQRRQEQLEHGTLDEKKKDFYEAATIACDAAVRFAQRHAERARAVAVDCFQPQRRRELEAVAAVCEKVARGPAESFHEALQAFWLTHVLLHVNSSEWSISPGRFDQYLWPYYRKDMAAGNLTRQQAKELLSCLWIKFNEVRVCAVDVINYQNLILGGIKSDGSDATNDLSYLCLEVTSDLKGLAQPSLSMRWHPGTPKRLLLEASKLILTGSGRPALFSDQAAIPALRRAGVSREDARDYGIAGCEELAVPGKLWGVIRGGMVNNVGCLLAALNQEPAAYEDLLAEYHREVAAATRRNIDGSLAAREQAAKTTQHPFVSLLFDDCIRDGRDIADDGARYNIFSISEAGTITAADSLFAVKKLVFEEKLVALAELRKALAANFQGHERLRARLIQAAPKFGNDQDEIDQFARQIVHVNHQAIEQLDASDFRGRRYVTGSGSSTAWKNGHHLGATPDGRLRGQSLSVSLGPSPGMDRSGPTAMLNSVAKLDWHEQAGGALTHLRLPYTGLQNPTSASNLASLVSAFFQRGGMGLHVSVIDAESLRQAQREPEKHLNLLVRLGGFSAPFVLLSPEIQESIIQRTEHGL